MEDVVPGALLRLREADIVSMAGLVVAALGQEYCRIGAVHTTKRQQARLTGIVDIPSTAQREPASSLVEAQQVERVNTEPGRYTVEVEVQGLNSWSTTCTCMYSQNSSSICLHAAALLYQWLAHPTAFESPSKELLQANVVAENPTVGEETQRPPLMFDRQNSSSRKRRPSGQLSYASALRRTQPPISVAEALALLSLSDLRTIAREYDITTTGLSKQQTLDAILDALHQPEAIRKVVGTLAKPQRQLLAAFTLAGGFMPEDDLRGLFERFSLGHANQLQSMLTVLQSKALVFRVNLNNSLQQRARLSSALVEGAWYVPTEVRSALHVTLPVTPFDVNSSKGEHQPVRIEHIEPYSLLADLLLIARALDGYRLNANEVRIERNAIGGEKKASALLARSLNSPQSGGAVALPPPVGRPSTSLLEYLQARVSRPAAFLRFAIRLLRLADILYIEGDANGAGARNGRTMLQNGLEDGTAHMRVLPNAARLLLSPMRREIARELFVRWLTQSTYEELFDLQEEGLRLRCHATPLNSPAIRPGELEMENSESRQTLLALLAEAPLNSWISFPAFARFVYRLNPTFLQKRQRMFASPHWWFEQQEDSTPGGHSIHSPLKPTHLHDWLLAEGRYLAQLLQGPLHWWGASDVALSHDGRLLAFRLTPMAGLLLGGVFFDEPAQMPFEDSGEEAARTAEQSTLPLLQVSEDGDVLIPCISARWPQIEQIERFAEVAGVREGQLCYRLTPKSLNETLSGGQSPAALLELLRQAASSDEHQVNTPLLRLLTQLECRLANYGRIRLYTDATLLEIADASVLRELSATTSLEKQTVQSISSTRLLLKKSGGEHLIEELRRRGQVPLMHEEEPDGIE